MQEEPPKQRSRWSSLLSVALFLLVVAGRPIANLVNHLIGGANMAWANILPIVAGGVVLLVIATAVVRALNRSTSMPHFPTPMQPPPARPPFHSQRMDASLPRPPRFDPVINPQVLVVGAVGLVVLAAIGVFVLVQFP